MRDNQTPAKNKTFFQKYIFAGNKKLLGSILTIILGLGLLGSAAAGTNPPSATNIGWALILGGAVCYSAKRV